MMAGNRSLTALLFIGCMQNGIVAPFLESSRRASEGDLFGETSLDAGRSLASSLAGTMEVSRALVRSGRRLDLSGLDVLVGLLCAKALDLEPEEGRILRLELISLRATLADLAQLIGLPETG